MKFIKTDKNKIINEFRMQLYKTFTTAIDSMWEALYIASSQTYLIEKDAEKIGYCCIDEEKSLTQIFLNKEHLHQMQNAIQLLIEDKLISSAKLSSIEPVSFNACLFHSKSLENNTFCFQHSNGVSENIFSIELKQASKKEINEIKEFYKTQVGFDDNFGYTENLVQRKELFVVRENHMLIGTGECRLSVSQSEFADVGVAVSTDFRKKGYATQILQQLVKKAQQVNRQPICSTTIDNIASKRAIEKAEFYCSHIIFKINFS